MTPEVIFGPPGTGKTSALLDLVDEELGRGTPPDKIGFVTFTKKGAEIAAHRAMERFGVSRKQLKWFRTLHSLCFYQLGLRSSEVFQGAHLRRFGEFAGVDVSGRVSNGIYTGFSRGDRCLHMNQLSRVRCHSLREEYAGHSDDLPWSVVEIVSDKLEEYKQNEGPLMDFTDMLEEFVKLKPRMGLDVLLVDEVQDQSILQWRVIEILKNGCRRVAYAGDDDQAIYSWAGADVDPFLSAEGLRRVLGKSHRVPRVVQDLANWIIHRVRRRQAKEWEPRDEAGSVVRAGNFAAADLTGDDVMVLARNEYVLTDQVEPILRSYGIVYEWNGRSSINPKVFAAIDSWEKLRAGGRVLVSDARSAYEFMSPDVGVVRRHRGLSDLEDDREVTMDELRRIGGLLRDEIWHVALDLLPREELGYILAARKRGEKLRQRPRIKLSTIHSSKGGEAEHVILIREMAPRTYREMVRDPDAELKVWYVAATRSRSKLTIVDGEGENRCPWL